MPEEGPLQALATFTVVGEAEAVFLIGMLEQKK